jgi:CRISPR system Cascade subunit CasD
MSVLLLRLEGPMQAWGTQSRFRYRDTGMEPSKSGVIGLLCAALGRPRTADLADLSSLSMGVRVDREGSLELDFHTAGAAYERGGTGIVSRRYYLADASFLVALEGPEQLLRRLDDALRGPTWQLCLGRKAFLPSQPIRASIERTGSPAVQPGSIRQALASWPVRRSRGRDPLRLVLESDAGAAAQARTDVPLSFADRTFATRHVKTEWMEAPQ